ncbi:unnamed protein product [Lupinus luteus]|uniref:Uncharacterized protein n=1 Tax=Lupinus luteus TaxID=3873 RepID=A0AAV1VZZ4_LUPLU
MLMALYSRGRQRLIQVLTSIRDRSMLKKKVVRKFGTSMMEQILDTCVLLYSIMFGLKHIMKEEDGSTFPRAQIINPANSGIHGTDGTVNSCQSSERPLNFPDRSMRKRKQCNIGRNDMEIGQCDNKISKTCNLEMTSVNDGYKDGNRSKMRCSKSLCLNSVSNSTMEAAILDLEELVNKIKWLRGVLDFEVPLLGAKQPAWEFLHHAPCK